MQVTLANVGSDILETIYPYLALKDLLLLRRVCRTLKNSIDSREWDRRYYSDFPNDALRLAGQGMNRYCKRYHATIQGVSEVPEKGEPLIYLNKYPIVDFASFTYGYGVLDEFTIKSAIVALCPDGQLQIRSETGASGFLDVWDISLLRIRHSTLQGWRNGCQVECDLDEMYDESSNKFERLEMFDEPEYVYSDEIVETLFENGPRKCRLVNKEASLLYYDQWECDGVGYRWKRDTWFDKNCRNLIKTLKVPFQCLWTSYSATGSARTVAASAENKVAIYIGNRGSEPVLYSYSLPGPIQKLSGYYEDIFCNFFALVQGQIYLIVVGPSKNGEPTEALSATPGNAELNAGASLLFDNVADMVGTTLLMNDGTVRTYDADGRWSDTGANGIMITNNGYLAVDFAAELVLPKPCMYREMAAC